MAGQIWQLSVTLRQTRHQVACSCTDRASLALPCRSQTRLARSALRAGVLGRLNGRNPFSRGHKDVSLVQTPTFVRG